MNTQCPMKMIRDLTKGVGRGGIKLSSDWNVSKNAFFELISETWRFIQISRSNFLRLQYLLFVYWVYGSMTILGNWRPETNLNMEPLLFVLSWKKIMNYWFSFTKTHFIAMFQFRLLTTFHYFYCKLSSLFHVKETHYFRPIFLFLKKLDIPVGIVTISFWWN